MAGWRAIHPGMSAQCPHESGDASSDCAALRPRSALAWRRLLSRRSSPSSLPSPRSRRQRTPSLWRTRRNRLRTRRPIRTMPPITTPDDTMPHGRPSGRIYPRHRAVLMPTIRSVRSVSASASRTPSRRRFASRGRCRCNPWRSTGRLPPQRTSRRPSRQLLTQPAPHRSPPDIAMTLF